MIPNQFGRADRAVPPSRRLSAARDLPVEGLTAGTIILTGDGEIPVEFLAPGDRIITRDAGMVRLAGLQRLAGTARLIRIAAGSLGHHRPDSDLTLPDGQRLLIRDWRARTSVGHAQALIRAGDLVDGEFVRDLGSSRVQLIRLLFNRPYILYAGGMEIAGCLHGETPRQAA